MRRLQQSDDPMLLDGKAVDLQERAPSQHAKARETRADFASAQPGDQSEPENQNLDEKPRHTFKLQIDNNVGRVGGSLRIDGAINE